MSLDLTLTLFFTDGVALATWQAVGMLEREVALYQALVERGARVRFVTYGDKGDLDLGHRLPGIRVLANRWKLPRSLYRALLPWRLPAGERQIYKSNQIPGALPGLRAAHRRGLPFIARCGYWWADFAERRYGPDSAVAREARRKERQAFGAADAVVVSADWIRAGVIERYELQAEKVHVIPNYVQTERFQPQEQPQNQRFQAIYVGRLAPEKNLPALIEAVSKADIDLTIVGEGPEQPALEALAASTGARVRFLGGLPNRDLPAQLNRADAFILPSLHEGQPKTLQEAMACGLPVIGCDVVGVRDLIEDGETGLLTGTAAEDLRTALQRMMEDAGLRQRLGRQARAYVLEHFALDRVVAQEVALYQELLG